MAAEIIAGQAVIHGVKDNDSAITLTGYATFVIDSLAFKHEFKIEDGEDSLGNDAWTKAWNEAGMITIDFTPDGATRAAAAAIPVMPIPLSAVTISNCIVQTAFGSSVTKLFDGVYQYRGGTEVKMEAGKTMKMTGMQLKKWADPTQNTNLTTTVSG